MDNGEQDDFDFDAPRREDAIHLLALWRTMLPHDAPWLLAERMQATIVSRCRAAIETDDMATGKERQLPTILERAEICDAAAWLDLAETIGDLVIGRQVRTERGLHLDLYGSCVWCAARHGSRWAHLLLILALIAARHQAQPDGVADLMSRLTTLSRTAMPQLVARPRSLLAKLEIDISDLSPLAAKAPSAPEKIEAAEPPVVPSMRVLDATPPPPTSREDKELVGRYAVLAQPVPLIPVPDADVVATELAAQYPWLANVIDEVRQELSLARLCGASSLRLPPTLLVGAPGVGKSRFARHLARALGVPMGQISAAGSSDNRALQGTARGWGTMSPCLPLTVMLQHNCANPLIVVDEIDKASNDPRHGKITDTLLTMLEKTTASNWPDEALLVSADLSRINWVLIANRLDSVPTLLRARCRVLNLGAPRPEDFDIILMGVLGDLAEEYGCDASNLPQLADEVVMAMRRAFQRGHLQARQLAALVRRVLTATTAPAAVTRH